MWRVRSTISVLYEYQEAWGSKHPQHREESSQEIISVYLSGKMDFSEYNSGKVWAGLAQHTAKTVPLPAVWCSSILLVVFKLFSSWIRANNWRHALDGSGNTFRIASARKSSSDVATAARGAAWGSSTRLSSRCGTACRGCSRTPRPPRSASCGRPACTSSVWRPF